MTDTCPRFERCSAPICPLDPDWRLRRHLPGEAVCGMALEGVKTGAEGRFEARGWGELYVGVVQAIPEMTSRWERIRYALQRAARSASKMESKPPVRGDACLRAAGGEA